MITCSNNDNLFVAAVTETIVNVAINNANLSPIQDHLISDKDVLMDIMETLNVLKTDLENIKLNVMKIKNNEL